MQGLEKDQKKKRHGVRVTAVTILSSKQLCLSVQVSLQIETQKNAVPGS